MVDRQGRKIQSMFDRISPRYDLLNRLISGGQDLRWRRRAVDLLGDLTGKTFLDLCCGSGDFISIIHKKFGDPVRSVGIDFSENMLRLAADRFYPNKRNTVLLCRADAQYIPLPDNSVAAVTIGFGIRNVEDRLKALKEIARVLQPGGKLAMIEPARPANPIIRFGFSIYFKYISPLIGGLLSGDRTAYTYLYKSFVAFPPQEEFLDLMARAGFSENRALPQNFGTAMIYIGKIEKGT